MYLLPEPSLRDSEGLEESVMPHRLLVLPRGHAQSLHLRESILLEVLRGRVWLTLAHDRQDYFVAAGTSLCVPAGHAVVEADGAEAWCRLQAAPPQKDQDVVEACNAAMRSSSGGCEAKSLPRSLVMPKAAMLAGKAPACI